MMNKIALAASLATTAMAATRVSDQQMTDWLNAGGVDLADAYAPIYFFGQMQNQPPCIPDWAFDGTPNSPDIYDSAHMTAPAPQCEYPNFGCGCRQPDVGIGNPAPQFPIYYTYQKCKSNEVRVAYNLFYQKDGATVGPIQTGHDYDWERIIIVHVQGDDGTWGPAECLMSAHSGYHNYLWGDIQNTLTTQDIQAGNAKTPNGVKNNDHPKVYVSASKHANFDDRNTGWNDPASQSTDNAFRSQDWWTYVNKRYYIRSDRSTAAGQALGSADWGSADSNPPKVHDGLCDISVDVA